MKQVASPGALKQVKLVASELRASPPKNEARGFARGFEASEASSFRASRFAPYKNEASGFARALRQVKLIGSELRASPPKNEASGFARGSEASEASSFGASRFAP